MLLPAQLILGETAAVVYVQRCGGTAPHNDNHSISRERERERSSVGSKPLGQSSMGVNPMRLSTLTKHMYMYINDAT